MQRIAKCVTMETVPRNWILFRTELFLYEQPDDQIDRWLVGGDCAGWIYARLLPLPTIAHDWHPAMEDWGWYASVLADESNTSIGMLFYAWPFLDNSWLIGLQPRKKLFRKLPSAVMRGAVDCVADGIDHILTSDDRFESFGWYEQNPFETDMTDPRQP